MTLLTSFQPSFQLSHCPTNVPSSALKQSQDFTLCKSCLLGLLQSVTVPRSSSFMTAILSAPYLLECSSFWVQLGFSTMRLRFCILGMNTTKGCCVFPSSVNHARVAFLVNFAHWDAVVPIRFILGNITIFPLAMNKYRAGRQLDTMNMSCFLSYFYPLV